MDQQNDVNPGIGATWKARGLMQVFASLAIIYNPIVVTFSFNGERPLYLVGLSIVPFMASLIWIHTEQVGPKLAPQLA